MQTYERLKGLTHIHTHFTYCIQTLPMKEHYVESRGLGFETSWAKLFVLRPFCIPTLHHKVMQESCHSLAKNP